MRILFLRRRAPGSPRFLRSRPRSATHHGPRRTTTSARATPSRSWAVISRAMVASSVSAPMRPVSFGARYDIRPVGALLIGIGVYHGNLERLIVDPFVVLANRVKGPVKQPVTFAELALQFNLTGGKTWHRSGALRGGQRRRWPAKSTPSRHQHVQLRQEVLSRPGDRVSLLPHRPAAPAGRGPGHLLEAELSHHISGAAQRGSDRPAGAGRQQYEGMDLESLAPGRSGLLFLALMAASLTRTVGFHAVHHRLSGTFGQHPRPRLPVRCYGHRPIG